MKRYNVTSNIEIEIALQLSRITTFQSFAIVVVTFSTKLQQTFLKYFIVYTISPRQMQNESI